MKRKISLNKIKEGIILKIHKTAQVTEQYSVSTRDRRNTMKIATNRQSLNILEYFIKLTHMEVLLWLRIQGLLMIIRQSETALEEPWKSSFNMRTDENILRDPILNESNV